MATLDPDMGRPVHRAMEAMGIDVRTEVRLDGVRDRRRRAGDARSRPTTASFPADLVVLGTGVAPGDDAGPRRRAARWAGGAGWSPTCRCGSSTPTASGRPATASSRSTWCRGNRVHVALGTHANKQGRVLGTNLGGGYATFPGVVGTAVSKVCELEIARTGLREADCDAGRASDGSPSRSSSTTRAGYFPDAAPDDGQAAWSSGAPAGCSAAQIVGREGAAKRIDVLAVALWNRMTVEEIALLDLGYAPPFSPGVGPGADRCPQGGRRSPDRLRRLSRRTACCVWIDGEDARQTCTARPCTARPTEPAMPIATPEVYAEMLDRAKAGAFAYPAINVTSSQTLNAALQGFAEAGSDGIVQVSTGGAEYLSGQTVKDMVIGAPGAGRVRAPRGRRRTRSTSRCTPTTARRTSSTATCGR